MHPGEKPVYEISVDSTLRDPIMGSGSLPAEDLKWMSSFVRSVELWGVSAWKRFSVAPCLLTVMRCRAPYCWREMRSITALVSRPLSQKASTTRIGAYYSANTTFLRVKL